MIVPVQVLDQIPEAPKPKNLQALFALLETPDTALRWAVQNDGTWFLTLEISKRFHPLMGLAGAISTFPTLSNLDEAEKMERALRAVNVSLRHWDNGTMALSFFEPDPEGDTTTATTANKPQRSR